MINKTPIVALVGRVNVGKSTLFNALLGKNKAIVSDLPGVTADRCYALARKDGHIFSLVDTGGLYGDDQEMLSSSIKEQTMLAISEADIIVAVFDGKVGPHAYDEQIVRIIKESGKEAIWVANKCEKQIDKDSAYEFMGLGIDDILPISAAHRHNLFKLEEAIVEKLDKLGVQKISSQSYISNKVKIAIIGRPNVGKSTYINTLLGEERHIVSPQSGTTKDAIDSYLRHKGKDFLLIDTAGIRRKSKIKKDTRERYSVIRSFSAIERADIAVLLLDAIEGVTDQDKEIVKLVFKRGIGLIIAVNKWDAVEKDHKTAKEFQNYIYKQMPFASFAPVLFLSAKTGQRCVKVLDKARDILQIQQDRIKTADLNKVIERAVSKHQPPVYRGREVKIYFATQVANIPITFIMFCNYPSKVPQSYLRYLEKNIRKEFNFSGCPIKIILRKRTEKEDRIKKAFNN